MTSHETENRGYIVPHDGDEDWHLPVNENWESIDADIQAVFDTAQAAMDAVNNDGGA